VAAPHGFLRRGERMRVGRKGVRAAAKHVARKLVEQQDQCEAFARCIDPWRESALRRLVVDGKERVADLRVEFGRLCEPARVAIVAAEPEGEHLSGAGVERVHAAIVPFSPGQPREASAR